MSSEKRELKSKGKRSIDIGDLEQPANKAAKVKGGGSLGGAVKAGYNLKKELKK